MHDDKARPLTIKKRGDTGGIKDLDETTKENEGTQNGQKSCKNSMVAQSISLVVLHMLDTLLLMILLPFMICQWISASDRFRIVLKAVVEVTLELLMWMIFAGVSIVMTTAFVLDDSYFRNNEHENLTQFVRTPNASTSQSDNKLVTETLSAKKLREEAT